MATAGSFSALDICGTQFNRLTSAGVPLNHTDAANGNRNSVLTCGLVDIARAEVLGDERTIRDANGSGGYCAERVMAAPVIGHTYTITLCSRIDPELLELFGLVDRVLATATTVGFKAKDLTTANCDCAPASTSHYGVSMIAWSLAWDGDERKSNFPYLVEIAPKITWRPGMTRTKSAEFNTIQLVGDTAANAGFAQGPGDIYPEVAGLDRQWAEVLTTTAWPGGCNCGLHDGYVPATTPPVVPLVFVP